MAKVGNQNRPSTAASRWTSMLAQGGFTPVVNSFIEYAGRPVKNGGLGLNPSQAMTVLHLIVFKRDERMPFPAVKKHATRMGLTEQSVRANLKALVTKKLLVKHLRRGTTALFDLSPLFQRLEVIQQRGQAKKAKAKLEAEAMLLPEYHQAKDSQGSVA